MTRTLGKPYSEIEYPVIGKLHHPSRSTWAAMRALGLTVPTWFDIQTPAINALVRVGNAQTVSGTNRRLDILAIEAPKRRQGHARAFIAACKEQYDTIAVWDVENATFLTALVRWGVRPVAEDIGDVGAFDPTPVLTIGVRWDR